MLYSITKKNKENLNDFNLHDSTFTGFEYKHNKNVIVMFLDNSEWGSFFNITFKGVIYQEITYARLWGEGHNIIEWYCDDRDTKIDDLLIMHKNIYNVTNGVIPSFLNENNLNDYIVVILLLNSGDKIKIICNQIDINGNKNK